jgi:hypothetical protein
MAVVYDDRHPRHETQGILASPGREVDVGGPDERRVTSGDLQRRIRPVEVDPGTEPFRCAQQSGG